MLEKSRNLGCSGSYLLRFEAGKQSLMAHKHLPWCLTFTAMLTKHKSVLDCFVFKYYRTDNNFKKIIGSLIKQ